MSGNLPLPAPLVFGLRYARFVLNVLPVHFGLQLGISPQKQAARLGCRGFPNMLYTVVYVFAFVQTRTIAL